MKERLNAREDQMKRSNLLLIGVPEAENRENWGKAMFNIIMTDTLQNLNDRHVQ